MRPNSLSKWLVAVVAVSCFNGCLQPKPKPDASPPEDEEVEYEIYQLCRG